MFNPTLTAGDDVGNRCPRRFAPVWVLLAVLFLVPQPARAYIDPGAGTMIWQMLVAGFLGAAFYLRRLIPGRRSKKKTATPPKS